MAQKINKAPYPLSALRAVVLQAQGLTAPNAASLRPTLKAIEDLVKMIGYVQIDTLQVVNRAHYVTLWARFGSYDLANLHRLVYTPGERRLYEGWAHAACFIPLEHFRYHSWRTDRNISYNPAFRDWLSKPDSRLLMEQTLERIRTGGGLRVGDLEDDGGQRGEWYDWKPNKMALEALFAHGELMVAERVSFQRVYDLSERVLPEWVDLTPVSADEGRRFCLEAAARALGVFERRALTFYAYMRATPARQLLEAMSKDGTLVEIRGESLDGPRKWLVHRDNLFLLERAAQGEIRAERTTFISPFDSLLWDGGRNEKLFGFKPLLECYKPAGQRVYGYFTFPILHRDRLVGRFDPKLERKTGVLHLNALYLEPGVPPEDDLVAGVATALRDFMAWHGAKDLAIAMSDPTSFGRKLLRCL